MGRKDAPTENKAVTATHSGERVSSKAQEQLGKEATRIGYPLILKAVLAWCRECALCAIRMSCFRVSDSAQEAQQAFGIRMCTRKRFLEHPRHIDFRCLVTSTANHSSGRTRMQLQRRHQNCRGVAVPWDGCQRRKDLGMKVRARAGRRSGYQCGHSGFLMDQDGSLYFIEMNTAFSRAPGDGIGDGRRFD